MSTLRHRPEVVLVRVESPVPMGSLTVATGSGWGACAPALCAARLPDAEGTWPGGAAAAASAGEWASGTPATGPDPAGLPAAAVQIEDHTPAVVTLQVPAGPFGVVALFPAGATAPDDVLLINRAELEWLSCDRAAPGQTVRAFGRALVSLDLYPRRDADDRPISYGGWVAGATRVVLRGPSGVCCETAVERMSAYDVTFRVPGALTPGAYQVHVHNGHGGAVGWSAPVPLQIQACTAWSTATFSVRDFGACGDGRVDDGPAIQAALAAAGAAGGGVVFFPAGSYRFVQTLRVPPQTVLRGVSRERSWLFMPSGMAETDDRDASAVVGIAGEGGLGLEELTLHAVYPALMVAAPVAAALPDGWDTFCSLGEGERADGSFIRRCRLLHNFSHLYHRRSDDPVFRDLPYLRGELHGHWKAACFALRGDYVEVVDSEFLGRGMGGVLAGCRYSRVAGCRLHAGEAANGLSLQNSFGGYSEIVLEDNELDGVAATHHSALWMMHGGRHLHLARNRIVRQFWVSDCEAILGHMWGYRQPVYVAAAEGCRVEVDRGRTLAFWEASGRPAWPIYAPDRGWDLTALVGQECRIFAGPGLGETRRVTAADAAGLVFDRHWRLPPTADSLLVVHEHRAFGRLTIVDNTIEDAGPSVMIWGHGHDSIIDGNRVCRSGLIGTFTVLRGGSVGGGCHFFQIINNHCDEGRFVNPTQHGPGGRYAGGGIGTHYSITEDFVKGDGLHFVGYLVRNNLLTNDSAISFPGYAEPSPYDYHRILVATGETARAPFDHLGLVIEDNTSRDCRLGLILGPSVRAVVRGHEFVRVEVARALPDPNG